MLSAASLWDMSNGKSQGPEQELLGLPTLVPNYPISFLYPFSPPLTIPKF